MTRQEELVWAAAWALSLQRTQGRMQPAEQHRFACSYAAEAVFGMQDFSANERILASTEDGDTMLRQMTGEPDCFIQRKPPSDGPGVYLLCEHPQVERCELCHVFGGWPDRVAKGCFLSAEMAAELPNEVVPDCAEPVELGSACMLCVRRKP